MTDFLICMLHLMCTLWIGIQFVSADVQIAAKVQAIIPPHILLSRVCIHSEDLKESIKIVGDSPVEYLYDTIYILNLMCL